MLGFVAVLGLSLAEVSGAALCCGAQASHCSGLPCGGAQALGPRASVVAALRGSSCGTRAQLPRGTWNLPGPGTEPVSPASAGGLLSPVSPGKFGFIF